MPSAAQRPSPAEMWQVDERHESIPMEYLRRTGNRCSRNAVRKIHDLRQRHLSHFHEVTSVTVQRSKITTFLAHRHRQHRDEGRVTNRNSRVWVIVLHRRPTLPPAVVVAAFTPC